MASGSSLTTKQRIFQNASSDSTSQIKTELAKKSSLANTLANIKIKKTVPQPPRVGSGSVSGTESRPAQGTIFADVNEIAESPVSYHNVQDDIPSYQPLQSSLPPEAR